MSNDGYIRRIIKPALGHLQVRKVRGPVLDLLYARLKRCGDPSCAGKPFIEHRNVPDLTVDPADRRPAWQQVAEAISDAIGSGALAPGDSVPSVRELERAAGRADGDAPARAPHTGSRRALLSGRAVPPS